MRLRRSRLQLALFTPVALTCGCASDPSFAGPMPVRDQHPVQLTVLHLDPRVTAAKAAGSAELRWNTAYSSLFLGGSGQNGAAFAMDGELLRTALGARVGLGGGLDLGFEVPLIYANGGFMDSFLIGWHEFWGFPDQNRSDVPNGDFLVRAVNRGAVGYEIEDDTVDVGDVPLTLTWSARSPENGATSWGLALRAGLEIPSGDQRKGFGNGELDVSVGVLGEFRHDWVGLVAHASYTFAGTPDAARAAQFDYGDVTSLGIGLEAVVHDNLSLLAQTEWETSALRDLGFARVADPQWLIWLGSRIMFSSDVSFELAIGEDISEFVAPDFSLWAGLRVDL